MSDLTDRLSDRALRGLIGAAMRLPYQSRVRMAGAALARGLGPLAGFRKRAVDNLTLIWPDMPPYTRLRIAQGALDNFGRTLIENYSHTALHDRLADTPATGAGLPPLAAARDAGRAVIFVTGHFANHEVPRHVLTHMGYHVGGLYRPMANPHFDAHYARTMTDWGGPVFAQGREGTIGFARHLARGGMGTLLFDVNSDSGEPIDFLGRPAMTATSAAELALRFDALILPYFATRLPDGLSFTVEVEAPITGTDPIAMTAEMNARLAERVTAHPAQWFWVHRRWKDKRGRIARMAD